MRCTRSFADQLQPACSARRRRCRCPPTASLARDPLSVTASRRGSSAPGPVTARPSTAGAPDRLLTLQPRAAAQRDRQPGRRQQHQRRGGGQPGAESSARGGRPASRSGSGGSVPRWRSGLSVSSRRTISSSGTRCRPRGSRSARRGSWSVIVPSARAAASCRGGGSRAPTPAVRPVRAAISGPVMPSTSRSTSVSR